VRDVCSYHIKLAITGIIYGYYYTISTELFLF